MKNRNLFIPLFYILILSISINKVDSQQATDSTNYYFNLAINLKQENDFSKSFNYFEKQRISYKNQNNTLGEVYILIKIAQIQRRIGRLYESENTSVEALKLLDGLEVSENQDRYRVSLYNHLGILYKQLENYKESVDYYNKTLSLTNDPEDRITVLNNIGNVYKEQRIFESAIEFYEKSYQESLNFKGKEVTARALDNLGFAQSKINISEALANMIKALNLKMKINDNDDGIITSYLHLGEYYKDRGDRDKALLYANKALDIADSNNNIEHKKGALDFFINLSTNPRILEFKKLNDSVFKSNLTKEGVYSSIIYERDKEIKKTKEEKERADANELKNTQQKLKTQLSQFIIAFILLLSISLYFILKSKHKKEKLKEIYTTETRISKKVHDEVANDVYHVMTKLQSNSKDNDNVIDDLEGIYNKTRNISKDNSAIEVNKNFESQLNDLLLSYKNKDVEVITRNITKIDWTSVPEIKKITLYRVLQELMTNMRKHSNATLVALTFNPLKGKIGISYTDNGRGCKLKKSTGLQNVENRITAIKGTVIFESEINKGFKAKITV